MYPKKDKFKTVGQEMKLKNIMVDDLDDIYHFETQKNTRTKTSKTLIEKGTKTIKSNIKLVLGRVVEVKTNYTYTVDFESCKNIAHTESFIRKAKKRCILSGRLKYIAHNSRNPICVGDFVNVDISESDNFRIEEIVERKNILTRYIHPKSVLLASNIDQVVIMTSVKDPEFNSNLIDRYICAAEISDIDVVLCVNKTDLISWQNTESNIEMEKIKKKCDYYTKMDYNVVYTSTITGDGIEGLRTLLHDKVTVFSGHSGTGKSSIINYLEPGINLKVGDVSHFHNKGTHITTGSRMLPFSFGGYLIDTPGIKTFGLKPSDIDKIAFSFPGFIKYTESCSFKNCIHIDEENCAIKKMIDIEIPEERYISYLNLRKNLC